MDVEEFVRLAVRRDFAVTIGRGDPAPELYWSAPLNTAEFIFALQRIGDDRWGDYDVEPYVRHLHVGTALPN